MRKLLSIILAFILMLTAYNAFASGFGGLGDLFNTLTEDDPDVGDVLDGISGLFGEQDDSPKESPDESEDDLPSLVGPFEGKKVKVKVGKKTYSLHVEFKDVMDKYEEYFDKYIELMNNMDKPGYMTKYLEFMQKYTEVTEALDKLDKMTNKEKGWTKDENAYYTYVMLQIDKKLLAAMNQQSHKGTVLVQA